MLTGRQVMGVILSAVITDQKCSQTCKGLSKHENGLSKHENGLSKHEKGLSEHEKGLSDLDHSKMYRQFITKGSNDNVYTIITTL